MRKIVMTFEVTTSAPYSDTEVAEECVVILNDAGCHCEYEHHAKLLSLVLPDAKGGHE